jgi:diacylglycerol kinase
MQLFNHRSFIKTLLKFKYAFHGLQFAARTETSLWWHTIATTVAILSMFILKMTMVECIAIVICVCVTLSAELFNTAIEYLCDVYTKKFDKSIKIIKDISAAAVTILCMGDVIVFVLIVLSRVL